jgi:hypothetical protein
MTGFDVNNPHVRQVITPDGVGEFESRLVGDPNKVLVRIKMPGKKLSDFRAYAIDKLQEVEK